MAKKVPNGLLKCCSNSSDHAVFSRPTPWCGDYYDQTTLASSYLSSHFVTDKAWSGAGHSPRRVRRRRKRQRGTPTLRRNKASRLADTARTLALSPRLPRRRQALNCPPKGTPAKAGTPSTGWKAGPEAIRGRGL